MKKIILLSIIHLVSITMMSQIMRLDSVIWQKKSIVYRYDENGNILHPESESYHYIYDLDGNVLLSLSPKEINRFRQTSTIETHLYEYDYLNRLICDSLYIRGSFHFTDKRSMHSEVTHREYDDDTQLLMSVTHRAYMVDKLKPYSYRLTYEYTDRGVMARRLQYALSDLSNPNSWKLISVDSCDKRGNLIMARDYLYEGDTVRCEYDQRNLLTLALFYHQGRVIMKREINYDSYGNPLHASCYSEQNGKLECYRTYVFEYNLDVDRGRVRGVDKFFSLGGFNMGNVIGDFTVPGMHHKFRFMNQPTTLRITVPDRKEDTVVSFYYTPLN